MRLHKTGHGIADTISEIIGELPDGDYKIVYGILRHHLFNSGNWFEIDKGFWCSGHYDGNYRVSFKGTQPLYDPSVELEPLDIEFEDWVKPSIQRNTTLICPPTSDVCSFFGIDYAAWLTEAIRDNPQCRVRHKGNQNPIDWKSICKVVTFNSTVGIDALMRGIPVDSNPRYSTIGSYTKFFGEIQDYSRINLFQFMNQHQFKLSERGRLCGIIKRYMSM